jgi:phenolic acid decarboxylase
MKISTVLHRARPHLQSKGFVCWAIDHADAPKASKERAKQYIRNLICPYATVTEWLNKKGISGEKIFMHSKEYRLRWIDHMVAELEKEGK